MARRSGPYARFTMGPGGAKRLGFRRSRRSVSASRRRGHAADLQLSEFQVLRPDDEPLLRHGIKWWWFKSAKRSFWDWPQAGPTVLGDEYADADVADCRSAETVNLVTRMSEDGTLTWDVPPGRWTVRAVRNGSCRRVAPGDEPGAGGWL